MTNITYENYNVSEAIEFLHKLFYNKKGTLNLAVSRVIAHAYMRQPFVLRFQDSGVLALVNDEVILIYKGKFEMNFKETKEREE